MYTKETLVSTLKEFVIKLWACLLENSI